MTLAASLGMYDAAPVRDANDRLWSSIAAHLRSAGVEGVPERLDRSRPLADIWDDPDLLLGQCCGYPLVTAWRGRLRYVATPRYRAFGCEGTSHRSRIIVRWDDPAETLHAYRGQRVAVNDPLSNTGMNLLRALVAPLSAGGRFFGSVVMTGSHAASARLVTTGEADIAAIDGVTYALLERDEPALTKRLRTLTWTAPSPALPFVTSARTDPRIVRLLRRALILAIEKEPAAAERLMLGGIENIGIRRYEALNTVERRAARAGYAELL
jgi:ABC-type phosphate/phosphonate transport system substrate-binding protein